MDGDYDGQAVECPHCHVAVRLEPINSLPELATGAVPPVLDGIPVAELAGSDQDVGVVTEVLSQVKGYCTDAETVLRLVVQSKLMAATIKPDVIVATNRRMIILDRSLFATKMWDALWVDIGNVQIEESITGATISVVKTNGQIVRLDKLPKASARELYRLCQSKEELMRTVRYAQNINAAQAGASKINLNVGR